MEFYIYKSVRKSTGEYYIGKRCFKGDIQKDKYMGSGSLFVVKYNKDPSDWEKEILKVCKDRDELANEERKMIGDLWEKDSKCLNLKQGGEGGGVPGRLNSSHPFYRHEIHIFYLNGLEMFTGTQAMWRREFSLPNDRGVGKYIRRVISGERFSCQGWSILKERPLKTCSKCGHTSQARGFNLHPCN